MLFIKSFEFMRKFTDCRRNILISFFLIATTGVVFWQVTGFDFTSFDDYMYVRDNPYVNKGFSCSNLKWAFTALYAANWHPLTWISHMLDAELFGLKPGMHHMTNLAFHILNVLMLFYFLNKTTGAPWRSAIVAALFALHPIHVESVAWIAERKDVLSAFFGMLTLISYAWYVKSVSIKRYLVVAFCFMLGLMSKPMLVTFPFVLLLLDFWPLKRLSLSGKGGGEEIRIAAVSIQWSGVVTLILEKIPILILTGLASFLTLIAQSKGGAISTFDMVPFHIRVQNMVVSYISYLGKIIFPFNLAVFYPYPKVFSTLTVSVSLFVLISLTLVVLVYSRRFPFLLVGWLWYLGTLVPAIGILQVGTQAMADRYTYIPLIGVLIALVWGSWEAFGKWEYGRRVLIGTIFLLIPGFMWLSWIQTGTWKNDAALFSHALDVTEDNYLAHNSLGAALFNQGKVYDAMYHYREALRIKPKFMHAENNLGAAYAKLGNYEEAIHHYRQSLTIDPNFAGSHYNLGIVLALTGNVDEAITEYEKALLLEPRHASSHNNLGFELSKNGRIEDSLSHYKIALEIEPGFLKARLNLMTLLSTCGRIDEAIRVVNEGLQLDTQNPFLRYERAELFIRKGYKTIAMTELQAISNTYLPALNRLTALYVQDREYDRAMTLLKDMLRQRSDNPEILYNIACVYAKQGMTEEAVNWLKLAVEKGFGNPGLIETDPDLSNIRGHAAVRELIRNRQQGSAAKKK